MKKFLNLLLLVLVISSCNNKEKNTSCQDCQTYTGDFLYLEGVAVLKGTDFIYKLIIDSEVEALEERVKPIKKEAYEMVEVKLKGVLSKKQTKEEGWEEVLQIKEILSIAKQTSKSHILIQQ